MDVIESRSFEKGITALPFETNFTKNSTRFKSSSCNYREINASFNLCD